MVTMSMNLGVAYLATCHCYKVLLDSTCNLPLETILNHTYWYRSSSPLGFISTCSTWPVLVGYKPYGGLISLVKTWCNPHQERISYRFLLYFFSAWNPLLMIRSFRKQLGDQIRLCLYWSEVSMSLVVPIALCNKFVALCC